MKASSTSLNMMNILKDITINQNNGNNNVKSNINTTNNNINQVRKFGTNLNNLHNLNNNRPSNNKSNKLVSRSEIKLRNNKPIIVKNNNNNKEEYKEFSYIKEEDENNYGNNMNNQTVIYGDIRSNNNTMNSMGMNINMNNTNNYMKTLNNAKNLNNNITNNNTTNTNINNNISSINHNYFININNSLVLNSILNNNSNSNTENINNNTSNNPNTNNLIKYSIYEQQRQILLNKTPHNLSKKPKSNNNDNNSNTNTNTNINNLLLQSLFSTSNNKYLSSNDILILIYTNNMTNYQTNPTHNPTNPNNPKLSQLFCIEYISNIYENFLISNSSNTNLPLFGFLSLQNSITPRIRSISLFWLAEVHYRFNLNEDTLFLAVNIFDRYISKKQTTSNSLQLLCSVCLFIASKFHEIYAPEIQDFLYVSKYIFNSVEFKRKEEEVLDALEYDLIYVSSYEFMNRLYFIIVNTGSNGGNSNNSNLDNTNTINTTNTTNTEYSMLLYKEYTNKPSYYFTLYLLEIVLLNYEMLKYNPLQQALGCLILSKKIFKEDIIYNDNFKRHSLLNSKSDMNDIVKIIYSLYVNDYKEVNSSSQKILKMKFADVKYGRVILNQIVEV